MRLTRLTALALLAAAPLLATRCPPAHAADGPVSVLTSTTDLADIVRTVGGDMVSVTSLCTGPEDPHFLDARPSFIRLAANAEMLVVVGMELEVGYLPLMLREGSNPAIRPGGPGYLDASVRIKKLQVVEGGEASRALGDVHPLGNPHYLYDPANAVIVADEVADTLRALRPAESTAIAERAKAFRAAVSELMLGSAPKDSPRGRKSGGDARGGGSRGAGQVIAGERSDGTPPEVTSEPVGAPSRTATQSGARESLLLSGRGLSARVGGRVLFEGLALEVHRGELLALT